MATSHGIRTIFHNFEQILIGSCRIIYLLFQQPGVIVTSYHLVDNFITVKQLMHRRLLDRAAYYWRRAIHEAVLVLVLCLIRLWDNV